MLLFIFLFGFFFGIFCFLSIIYILLFNNVFSKKSQLNSFINQYQPLRIPQELLNFLRLNQNGEFAWESCLSLSLFLHFLFQEHKDSQRFRRWVYKKIQLELNDVTTRSTISRIILGFQIRDLSLGTEIPVIKNIRVENYEMSENCEFFEKISFECDIDYSGGFETSVDVSMIFNRLANLSVKVVKLSGKARITVSRKPFSYWNFAFIEMPILDFKIESQFQGRQLKHIIPLIMTAFRKAFQCKHVWPNYKIRYRPLFPHPFLQPALPISSFDHIKMSKTALEITVLQCNQLNTRLFHSEHAEVFCVLSLDKRPISNNCEDSNYSTSIMLNFTRQGASDSIGLTFVKNSFEKMVKIESVEPNSTADKCGFKKGDIILAINNLQIRNDKQALRTLSGTVGNLFVLVERDLNYYFDNEADIKNCSKFNDDSFIFVDEKKENNHCFTTSSFVDLKKTKKNDSDIYKSKNKLNDDESSFYSFNENESCNNDNKEFKPYKNKKVFEFPLQNFELKRFRSDSNLNVCINKSENLFKTASVSDSFLNHEYKYDEFVLKLKKFDEKDKLIENEFFRENFSEKIFKNFKKERFQARANEMALKMHAGRIKFNDFILNRNKQKNFSSTQSFLSHLSVNEINEYAQEAASINNSSVNLNQNNDEKFVEEMRNCKDLVEIPVIDKSKKNWIKRMRKLSYPLSTNLCDSENLKKLTLNNLVDQKNLINETSLINSRCTKSVLLNSNPFWDQSLHFGLDQDTTKYLNVMVYSRKKSMNNSITIDTNNLSDLKDSNEISLLGYMSVYVPQIIEDCTLTLSNYHRELFCLNPPIKNSSETEKIFNQFPELSRRTGFDPHLCYGNITLGFRFFSEGLPFSTLHEHVLPTETKSCTSVNHEVITEPTDVHPLQNTNDTEDIDLMVNIGQNSSENQVKNFHKWVSIYFKHNHLCNICNCKIWLKSASRCSVCNLICHNKCIEKMNGEYECSIYVNNNNDDSNFTVLENKDFDKQNESVNLQKKGKNQLKDLTNRPSTRRRHIASSVAEKLSSTWKNVGSPASSRFKYFPTKQENISNESNLLKKNAEKQLKTDKKNKKAVDENIIKSKVVTIDKILDSFFISTLKGAEDLKNLNFEPGNTYNPQIINATKLAGAKVFNEIGDYDKRKSLINQQIDKIKLEIDKISEIRRSLILSTPSTISNLYFEKATLDEAVVTSPPLTTLNNEIEKIDILREALALLTLYYCSGLSDCIEKEEEEIFLKRKNSAKGF